MNSFFSRLVSRILVFCLCVIISTIDTVSINTNNGVGRQQVLCQSIDIRNSVQHIEKYANCTIVDGNVRIVLLDRAVETNFTNVSFPELREITQYLLVYRIRGLKSLNQLFPNLALIRGTVLFSNTALAIYGNPSLQELGLKSLTHIMEGSVIIYKNPNLCYTNLIDWSAIMKLDQANRTYYEVSIGQNKEEKECLTQIEACKSLGCERDLCWSSTDCQRLNLEGCHPLCAGGCYQNHSAYHCYSCKGLLTTDGECVESCPLGSYEYLKMKCLTEVECRKINSSSRNCREDWSATKFFPFEGNCIDQCPRKYEKSKNGTTCELCKNGKCKKVCNCRSNNDWDNTFRIVTVGGAKKLQTCTILNGSLSIEIKTGNYSEGIENALENFLGDIEEITGQLKIMHSHALQSLNFLPKLKTIHGAHLNSLQHSLIVKDNKNLQKLWNWNEKPDGFQIKSGRILFHFNPKLCLSEIDKLIKIAKLPSYGDLEVSKHSNGYLAPCDLVTLNVTIEKRDSNSVILAIHQSSSSNIVDNFDRFMIYYQENTNNDLTCNQTLLYEDGADCVDSKWKMRDVSNPNAIILTQLEPNTEYAFYVHTYNTRSASSSAIGTSPLQYVKTLPAQPSAPLDFTVNHTTSSQVTLIWKPPSHSHGKLLFYKIRGYFENDTANSDLLNRDYCKYKLLTTDNDIRDSKSIFTTPAPVSATGIDNNNNCKCDNETKQNPEEVCNSFEHKTDFRVSDFENRGLETCDTFIYSVINMNYLMIRDLNEIEPAIFDLTENSKSERMTPINSTNSTGADGKYEKFYTKVPIEKNIVTIDNLRHFTEYIIMISVCRERDPSESDLTNSCSRESFVAVRTKKDNSADRIPELRLHTRNQTVNVSWDKPNFVNSFIHSYQLEYRSADTEYSKFVELCITSNEFEILNSTYTIDNLPSGRYEIRVKAISLAGDGDYIIGHAQIKELARSYGTIIVSSVVVLCIILFIVLGFLYYWRSQILKNRVLFASVNPQYEPIYLEDHWEIARENLTIVKQLGRGLFGAVHEGILKPDNIRCAVKTAVNFRDDMNAFLKEATLMKEFHNAHHIVKLLGVISKGSPTYVIMELMELGDLKSYLVNNRQDLVTPENGLLPFEMVCKIALEIADGMAYLEAKKFVHRDLAARNCMVSIDKTVKIGDFGLARDIYETDYYRKGDKGTLPIRWMAPESIRDGVFTSHSDSWSYGVVLWEIINLAQMPYHPLTNEEVIRYIQSGHILEIGGEDKCPQIFKILMLCCWKWHSSDRPKFTQIIRFLENYCTEDFKKVSYYHNGELNSKNDLDNVKPSSVLDDDYRFVCNDENLNSNAALSSLRNSNSNSISLKYYDFNPTRLNGYVNTLSA